MYCLTPNLSHVFQELLSVDLFVFGNIEIVLTMLGLCCSLEVAMAWRIHKPRPSIQARPSTQALPTHTQAPPTHSQAQLISSGLWDPGTSPRILTEPTPLLQACRLRRSQKAEIQALVSPFPASRLALFWGGRPSLGPAVLGELSQDISIKKVHLSACVCSMS